MKNLLLIGGAGGFPEVNGATIYRAVIDNLVECDVTNSLSMDVFEISSFLAGAFGIPKEKALSDYMEVKRDMIEKER